MSLEDVKKRFAEEVGRRAGADKYLDRGQEKEIVAFAVEQGITPDSARSVLIQVCEAQGCVLESKVRDLLRDYLDTAAGNDGEIDEKEYRDALTLGRKWTQGRRSDDACKRLIVEIIRDNGYRTSRGWFRSWFDRACREVGLEAARR